MKIKYELWKENPFTEAEFIYEFDDYQKAIEYAFKFCNEGDVFSIKKIYIKE